MLILISSQGHHLQLPLDSSNFFLFLFFIWQVFNRIYGFSEYSNTFLLNYFFCHSEMQNAIPFTFLTACTFIIWNLSLTDLYLLLLGVHCSLRTQIACTALLHWAQKWLVIWWASFCTPSPHFFFSSRKFHFAGNGGKSWQQSDWLGEINGCLFWLRAERLWRLTHSLMVK